MILVGRLLNLPILSGYVSTFKMAAINHLLNQTQVLLKKHFDFETFEMMYFKKELPCGQYYYFIKYVKRAVKNLTLHLSINSIKSFITLHVRYGNEDYQLDGIVRGRKLES